MPLYYETTPWLIPKADDRLAGLCRREGFFYTLAKGSVLQAKNAQGDGRNIILTQSGLIGQTYEMKDPARPHTISLVLPGRILNYSGYLGIDNRCEKLLILRDSDVWICRLEAFRQALEREGLSELFHKYCIDCVASDYGAFMCMFSCEAEQRLAHLFESLSRSLPCRTEGDMLHIPLRLTYAEMSYVMHSTVKTIERIVAKWHRCGALSADADGFVVSRSHLDKLID
jgi:CRP-like cAMP-binding protein